MRAASSRLCHLRAQQWQWPSRCARTHARTAGMPGQLQRRELAATGSSGRAGSDDDTVESFISRAKTAKTAAVLLGPFRSAGRFDACLEAADMVCTALHGGSATAELVVTRAMTNNYGAAPNHVVHGVCICDLHLMCMAPLGTLHGGAISTIVDVLGTLALLTKVCSRAWHPAAPLNCDNLAVD